ncbi:MULTISPECIES: fimbrial protein [unclassified Serratia (in: enterobacteria)]|uniref:fimbrial protein n=1 Tax=unclassified Serratia (in: enterobacteria) TaxID=2647522 RepID=UPI0030768129
MNKNLVAVAVLAASAFTANVFAADGQVNFTGTIIPQGCDISTSTKNQTVDLGKIAASSFPSAGSVSGSKGFSLVLSNCPDTVTAASVRFDGNQVPNNNSILQLTDPTAATTAKGVGIQIADGNNKVINLYQDSTPQTLQPGTAINTLSFVASYISTAASVTPGAANAVSNFTIVYQ